MSATIRGCPSCSAAVLAFSAIEERGYERDSGDFDALAHQRHCRQAAVEPSGHQSERFCHVLLPVNHELKCDNSDPYHKAPKADNGRHGSAVKRQNLREKSTALFSVGSYMRSCNACIVTGGRLESSRLPAMTQKGLFVFFFLWRFLPGSLQSALLRHPHQSRSLPFLKLRRPLPSAPPT